MNEINKALRSINIDIVNKYLLKSLSDNEIYNELVDNINLDLFNNNEDLFEDYVSLVTEIASITEMILDQNEYNQKERINEQIR